MEVEIVVPEVSDSHHRLTSSVITFIIVGLVAFFGTQYITRTGVFLPPGEFIYSASLSDSARDFISSNTEDFALRTDVTISEQQSLELLHSEDLLLYDILVPVADWNSPTLSITSSTLESLTSTGNPRLISLNNLDGTVRLLSVSGNYYLDTLRSGAIFKYISIAGNTKTDLTRLEKRLLGVLPTFPAEEDILTLAQTGVTAISRNMTEKLATVKDPTYFSTHIAGFLSSFDLTHTSNEASFTSRATTKNICSPVDTFKVLTDIGLDIVELTGNHNTDCGDAAAISTIDLYHDHDIRTFGGGKSATDAAIPLEIDQKNTHITMLGYNYSTGGYTKDSTPGANFYTEQKALEDIMSAKARGDFVIVDMQYYECTEYVYTSENTTCDYANSSAGNQIKFFRHLIDLGADIVVGTSAHQPQTYEKYKDGEIYYGLGNLFFDQAAWPGTTRSLILVHYFNQGKLLQTRLVPTVYNKNYQTKLMENTDAQNFLARLVKAQPKS